MPPSRAAASSVALATALCLAPRAAAMPSYRYKVPNGDRVACPPGAAGTGCDTAPLHPESDPESVCTGLGHATCAGADWPLNPFGIAFATAGFKWTETLCNEVRCAMVERGAARPPRCSPLRRGEVGGVCECDGASRARIARARRGCT